ncbi:hemolysin D [Hylemonella gracilis str. Niagara R]|uniref:Hemolysin D n=1 Tax=Hylemonella gracilis str. Niagara R TaxID=1458275 RepID=A0A016XMG8_9BURK|nr:hemolysin III family protein [Hylemonella gracilis]EYC52408.1 hemolysin D [Hylemonella gracilis str. Niagara R]
MTAVSATAPALAASLAPSTGTLRSQTRGEEIANSISHGIGALAALAAMPVLIVHASLEGTAADVVGVTIFAATMLLLYSISALYHALPEGRAKQVFVRLDHGSIYLFIAGSYTPFTLGVLGGAWGWSLFGMVWGLAVFGVILKAGNWLSSQWLSTGLYLLMGWLVLVAAVPMFERVSTAGLAWLVAGGLAYTLGVVFFALDNRVRYAHFIWHLFVLAGTACHFFAVLWHAR